MTHANHLTSQIMVRNLRYNVTMSHSTIENPQSKIDNPQSEIGGYHIMTWGCQMNEEDSEQMALYLEQMGYAPVGGPEQADVVLLNTCSVRQKPEEKVYSKLGELRELKMQKPDMIIGVCGCMAQVESAQIKRRAPFVDLVVGTGNIAAIPNLIRAAKERKNGRMGKWENGGVTQRLNNQA